MRTRSPRRAVRLVAVAIVLGSLSAGAPQAAPVEYLRECPDYGPGYYYVPGTDECHNPATNDVQKSAGSDVWSWRMPANPRQWLSEPRAACSRGNLVKLGDFPGASLTMNEQFRYETPQIPLTLAEGQYISSVIYKGGYRLGTTGHFCTYYYFNDPTDGETYVPLGCLHTGGQTYAPFASSFVPDTTRPPATATNVSLVGANGELWGALTPSGIEGSLSIWICVQDTL